MTNDKGKIQDPADAVKGKQDQMRIDKEMQSLDIASLDISSFKGIPETTARLGHPFDGYPLHDIVIGKDKDGNPVKTKSAFIVALAPTVVVAQDPDAAEVNGKKLRTYHSRFVIDYENGRKNTDVVFDREFELADGYKLQCAVVPSHSARAQLCFALEPKTSRVRVDKRYILLDQDQKKRLRKTFAILIEPKLKQERLADSITKEEGDS